MNAKLLIKKIEALGLEPYSYSGRGMYGDRYVAVDVDYIGEADGLPLQGASQDSMGMGMVIYWRGAPWPEEEETV